MRHEENSRPLECSSEPGVVDRCHHRLAGSGSRDEQIAVSSVTPSDLDLLEQPLLERSQVKLGGRQLERRRVVRRPTTFARRTPRRRRSRSRRSPSRTRTLPPSSRRHPDCAARDSNVPLEPSDLSAVGQVGRPDVRRRRAALPVEDPRLGVEPSRRRVVRDPHVDTDRRQLVECPGFGAVGVRRRQQPHATPFVTVSTQGVEQRSHAAPPDERHHHVDPDRRRDLGGEFVLDRRLAPSVRQHRGVEQSASAAARAERCFRRVAVRESLRACEAAKQSDRPARPNPARVRPADQGLGPAEERHRRCALPRSAIQRSAPRASRRAFRSGPRRRHLEGRRSGLSNRARSLPRSS